MHVSGVVKLKHAAPVWIQAGAALTEGESMEEKTIDTYSMLGKPIKNTKQQWVDRWKDCTVSSLAGLMPIGEYRDLVDRIITLAGEDFDRRAK